MVFVSLLVKNRDLHLKFLLSHLELILSLADPIQEGLDGKLSLNYVLLVFN